MPPMVMDDTLDVDDLFGDHNSLELNLNSAALTAKGLPQRLDELRLLGCCRKLTWSRTGAIAYISKDGRKVLMRHLVCSPNDGKWSLSEERTASVMTETDAGHTFVHLCWNDAGFELAVTDSCGRISTFGMSIALNALNHQRPTAMDNDDDGNQPVGLMWLSANRPIYALQKAVRSNGRWSYPRFGRRPMGPLHPGNKSALICVSRTGYLRLLFQQPDSKWSEVSVELRSTGYADDTLTHAGMVPVEGSGILLATYSSSGRLCLYRATIKWESSSSESAPKQSNANGVSLAPSIQLVPIKSEFPRPGQQAQGSEAPNIQALPPSQSSLFRLTHLEIITGCPDAPGGAFPPIVLSVFSSPTVQFDGQSQGGPSSVLVRWEIGSTSQKLHSSFDDVVSKKPASQLKPKPELQRQDDVNFDRFAISVDYMEAASLLAITFDDSTISFFDARSMAPRNAPDDLNTITSMPQAGFTFPPDTPGLHISFSPSACAAVALDADNQLHLRVAEHSFGAENGVYNDGKFSSAIAALSLACGRACGNDAVFDDVLLIASKYLTHDTQKGIIDETQRALNLNADFTIEQEKLMNNHLVQKCLSLQAALGFKLYPYQRSPGSAVAWFTLQLRQISILFTYFCFFQKSGETENFDPEILKIILGNVKWALDLAKYLVDDLFELAETFNKQSSDSTSGLVGVIIANPVLRTSTAQYFDNLTVVLLLASIPRSFLRYICRGLRGMVTSFRNANGLSTESLHLYSKILSLIEESPIKVDIYEKFLASIDSVVKHAYEGAGFSTADRATPERELLTTGNVPPVLQPAVPGIFTTTVTYIRPDVDRLRLYTYDYSWLGICDDTLTQRFVQTHFVDTLKRTVINPDDRGSQPKRRCTRCCSISEDVVVPRSVPALRMLGKTGMLRWCSCGGIWVVEKKLDNG